jgi:hypothetical protein
MREKQQIYHKHQVVMPRMRIIRGYPLTTSLDEKAKDAAEFPGITVFLNGKHTLAHCMYQDDPDGLYRTRIRDHKAHTLKGCRDEYVYEYFMIRLMARMIIGGR